MMRDQDKEQEGVLSKIGTGIINLTNELLRNYKISKIVYISIKVLEHLQLIYFLMRGINEYHWDFSFFVFFSVFLNLISLDQLFRSSPSLFIPIFYAAFIVILLILVLGVIISVNSGWSKKSPFLVKFFTPIVCTFLYLFKTVLIIPILDIVLISIIPSIASNLKITDITPSVRLMGGLLALFVLAIEGFVLTVFRESNPFCQLPFAGQTFIKGVVWFCLKVFLVLYSVFDLEGNWVMPATLTITALFLALIVYSHIQTGLYKESFKKIEIHLLYACFTMGILHSSDFSGGEITTIVYLPFLNFIIYFACEWILDWANKKIVTINLRAIEQPRQLQKHVIYLIHIIDNMHLRDCKVALEGYLQYHRRGCRFGEDCPCQNLAIIKEESEEFVKLESFKLVSVILLNGSKKFPDERKIDLLLGLLYLYRIRNSLQAVYAITKMAKDKGADLIDRLYESYYLQRIEKEMAELDEKEVNKTSQINKYFDYTNRLVKFEDKIEKCTNHHIDFWRLIMDANPDIRRLQDLGTLITRTKDQLKVEFDSIFWQYPNSIPLLNVYGRFLLEVTNEETYNVKYIEKADNILKNIKQTNKIDEGRAKYLENASTGVIIISGDDGRLGIMVHTNNSVRDLIGYKRSELLERNVQLIMPKIYGENHNAVLARYIKSSESKVNGTQRLVPALTKEGHMLPITALSKVLPSLIDGIQIVAFIAKFQLKNEDDDLSPKVNYLLYRSDTEQIVGVCENCSSDFGISTSLIYGNALNLNNELMIKHIFGISFQKSDEGRIAAALDVGEVVITLNTTALKDEFIISKGSKQEGLIEMEEEDRDHAGVEMDVSIKIVLCSIYNGTPLKLLSIQPRKTMQNNTFRSSCRNSTRSLIKDPKMSVYHGEQTKNEGDDLKNLKDFKNFISIKREPSAITALSTICLFFILIVTCSIAGLIFNSLNVISDSSHALKLYKLTLNSEMATPEILTQVQKLMVAYQAQQSGISTFTPISTINSTAKQIINLAKGWQLSILPEKYYFDVFYNATTPSYGIFSTGGYRNQSLLLEEVINNYITLLQTLLFSDPSGLVSSTAQAIQASNIHQKYDSAKINILYSIRNALNASNAQTELWYHSKVGNRKVATVAVNALIMGVTILWVILVLPYILSVTKINNRVLSLFTLISGQEICQLIYNCMNFLRNNLKEATINHEDLLHYEEEQGKLPQGRDVGQVNDSNAGSPSNMNLMSEYTQLELKKGGRMSQIKDSALAMEQKFQKMINSQDRNKKIVIFKFVFIALLILSFVFFYLFFGLGHISGIKTRMNNYYMVGRRPALIREVRLLLIQYLIGPLGSYLTLPSVRTLNQNIINEFYVFEANLLFITLGSSSTLFNTINNEDACAAIGSYAAFSFFNKSMNAAECYAVKAGVLQKGLKTGVVSVLEDIRSVLSQYPATVPLDVVTNKILEYDSIVKYIETPMLAVQSSVENDINSSQDSARMVIVLTGSIFIAMILICWRLLWKPYLSDLNVKIWRTKGLLNLIPMRIITANDLLKNEFTSGQLEKAVR